MQEFQLTMEKYSSSQDTIYQTAHILRELCNIKQENRQNKKNFFAAITVSAKNNYFIQVATISEENVLLAEASGIHPNSAKLSKDKIQWLTNNNWTLPHDKVPNYTKFLDVKSEQDLYLSAADIITTFIKIYDFIPTDPLTVEASEMDSVCDSKP